MKVLLTRCQDCKVAANCPKRGASPTVIGKSTFLCRLMDGYGREAVDPDILSAESKARSEKDGPCVTIAEVPVPDEQTVTYSVVKIFHHPILHPREKVDFDARGLEVHGYKPDR